MYKKKVKVSTHNYPTPLIVNGDYQVCVKVRLMRLPFKLLPRQSQIWDLSPWKTVEIHVDAYTYSVNVHGTGKSRITLSWTEFQFELSSLLKKESIIFTNIAFNFFNSTVRIYRLFRSVVCVTALDVYLTRNPINVQVRDRYFTGKQNGFKRRFRRVHGVRHGPKNAAPNLELMTIAVVQSVLFRTCRFSALQKFSINNMSHIMYTHAQ